MALHKLFQPTVLVLACLSFPGFAAERATTPLPDPMLDRYAQPAQLVDIGAGRKLNLRCSGSGKPTVVLEAGFGADSLTWAKLQPLLAGKTRVCAYDRAGHGYSDIGPMPRDIEAEAKDLRALVVAAELDLPAVFVGHSIGTNIIRRYDRLYPEDVAGLVLIDPPPQHVAEFSPEYAKQEAEMAPAIFAAYKACEQGAKEGKLADPPPELSRCLRGPNPTYGSKLNAAVRAYRSRPEFWQTLISGSEAKLKLFDPAVPVDEKHGDKPLLVLTANNAYDDMPDAAQREALKSAQNKTHVALAATSTRGERIVIDGVSHDIQTDKPELVAAAIVNLGKGRKR